MIDCPDRRCETCGGPLAGRERKKSCSGRCRAALSRKKKAQAQEERDLRIRELLETAVRLIGGNVENTPREGEIVRGEIHAKEAKEKH